MVQMGGKLPKLQEKVPITSVRENLRRWIFRLNKDSLVGSFLP